MVSILVVRFTWSAVCWIIEGEGVRITCSAMVWKRQHNHRHHHCYRYRYRDRCHIPNLVFMFGPQPFFLRSCVFGVRTLVSAPWLISRLCGGHGTAWYAHCATLGSPATAKAWARQSSKSCGTSGMLTVAREQNSSKQKQQNRNSTQHINIVHIHMLPFQSSTQHINIVHIHPLHRCSHPVGFIARRCLVCVCIVDFSYGGFFIRWETILQALREHNDYERRLLALRSIQNQAQQGLDDLKGRW